MDLNNKLCVEYVTFRLKKGVDITTFRQRSDNLDSKFLAVQDGFVSRKLLLLHDGETWADLALWQDTAAAKAAEAKFMKDPITKAYGELIDIQTIRMEHSNEVSHFSGMG